MKTTPPKAPKTAAKKKAAKTAPKKKAVKKSAKKAPAKKKAAARKASPAKASAKKPSVKKKTLKADKAPKAGKAPKKSAPKKAAPKGKAPSPADNGKSTKKQPLTPIIHRVVRPNPPVALEPVIEDWTPLSDAKLRKVKTELSRKELNSLKQRLLEKRAEIVGDVLNMEEARTAGNGGELSNMPLHMADVGSDNYEQEFTLGLVESERKLLIEIDAALMRIKNKIYGVCIISGTPIPTARLEIKPWAKYSIEIVRKREKLGLHSF